jgi:hypothetical protein
MLIPHVMQEKNSMSLVIDIPNCNAMDAQEPPAREAWTGRTAASPTIAKSLQLNPQCSIVFLPAETAFHALINLLKYSWKFKASGVLLLLQICDDLFHGGNLN